MVRVEQLGNVSSQRKPGEKKVREGEENETKKRKRGRNE